MPRVLGCNFNVELLLKECDGGAGSLWREGVKGYPYGLRDPGHCSLIERLERFIFDTISSLLKDDGRTNRPPGRPLPQST